jgi:hypothetical protein
MSGLGEVPSAARARDIFERIAESVVNKLRPEPFLAKVYDVDMTTQTARVVLAGETLNELMPVRFALDKIPRVTMASNPSLGLAAAGDIVRVAGKPGQYFILDFFSGNPYVPGTAEGIALHENPGFEGTWENGYPPKWTNFWNNGGVTAAQETSDVLEGSASIEVSRPSGGTARIHGKQTFAVTAGEPITISVWAKASGSTGTMSILMLSAPTLAGADFFGSGLTMQSAVVPLSTVWQKFSATFTVPPTHTAARQSFLVENTVAATMDFWLDDSYSERPDYVPWISIDGTDYTGQPNLFTNSWNNYGGSFRGAQYRKVGDVVQLRGLIKSGTLGAAAFTLPVGYRPGAAELLGQAGSTTGSNNAFARVDVNSAGGIIPAGSTNDFVSLSGFYFSTL